MQPRRPRGNLGARAGPCGWPSAAIVVRWHAAAMDVTAPFVGSEAIADGVLNRHQLRTRFRRVFPDVYLDKSTVPTLDTRIAAAWLWSQRSAVVAGLAASHLLGADWVKTRMIELVWRNTRPPRGIRCRHDELLAGEVTLVGEVPVTSGARTAFDIARTEPIDQAIAALDALLHATGVTVAEVERLAARHPGVRGLRRAESVLALVDPGSESPRETSLRLLLIRNGLPTPQTQIEVRDEAGYPIARLDMGWPELMVAVEYDGDQHRTDRRQYVRDVRRLEMLERLGWIVIRVVMEDSSASVLRRVGAAIELQRSRLNLRRPA